MKTSILNARDFVLDVIKYFGEDVGMELDYCTFTDMAEKRGLIRWEDYDREKHGDMDAEEGDRVWVPNTIEPICCGHCGDPIAVKEISDKYFGYCECEEQRRHREANFVMSLEKQQ